MNLSRFSLFGFVLAFACLCLSASCGGGSSSSTNNNSNPDDPASYNSGPDKYRIAMRTGCEETAGTNAKMYIQLNGDKGTSKTFLLENPLGEEFVSCSRDVFEIKLDKDIGKLGGFFLWHDNTGTDPSYKVEIVDVTYLKTGKKIGFPCGKWFATDMDDGKTKREFFDYRECK
ncbi:MAG: PLAT/LH2 domain-containing protein [Bacteroidota bacterium]